MDSIQSQADGVSEYLCQDIVTRGSRKLEWNTFTLRLGWRKGDSIACLE